MNSYIDVLKKYAVFSGRARRKEYWLFVLFNMFFSLGLGLVDFAAGFVDSGMDYGPFRGLYSLAVLVPGIAVGVRRLHDTTRSGWWFLIALVPCIGAILLLVFFASDSEAGDNRYGPNPKSVST